MSDDLLVERLVLKGGNALALAYQLNARVSADLDFSMPDRFSVEEFMGLETRLLRAFESTFIAAGLMPIDVDVQQRPPEISDDMRDFWGGYTISFKVVTKDVYERLYEYPQRLRRVAEVVAPGERRSFEIDISSHEVCSPNRVVHLSDYPVRVCAPELCVLEKLRAICQQMPEYDQVVRRRRERRSARPRDFFDIHSVCTKRELALDLSGADKQQLLKAVFDAKRVPVDWLMRIRETYDQHAAGWDAVAVTVHPDHDLRAFRFYFDFVVELAETLHPGRHE